jgi:hypothetical protein
VFYRCRVYGYRPRGFKHVARQCKSIVASLRIQAHTSALWFHAKRSAAWRYSLARATRSPAGGWRRVIIFCDNAGADAMGMVLLARALAAVGGKGGGLGEEREGQNRGGHSEGLGTRGHT